MHVLVTGGAGYIGSHTVLELLKSDHTVTVVDNLCNSHEESLNRVEKLTGKTAKFVKADLLDMPAMESLFDSDKFDAVIHFAALKAVGESVAQPLNYYRNNISGTVNLLDMVQKHGVKHFVFSSSATVYGMAKTLPLSEKSPTPIEEVTNPYGRTKLIMEYVLRDWQAANPDCNVALLRYFNPVGAHESGEIGEDPGGTPANLLPYVAQVAIGKRDHVNVFGDDYPTPDGTGVRDYIHVVDLAIGHVSALDHMANNPGVHVFNLGTGNGFSVLEIIEAFEKASGKKVAYTIACRRPGDIAACYADVSKIESEIGWSATRDLDQMCRDAWNWQSKNPSGFA